MIEQPSETVETGPTTTSPVRLGFNEIVPGFGPSQGPESPQNAGPIIPEFNLDQQMMAQHRRSTAARRKGPGQAKATESEPKPAVEPETQVRRSNPGRSVWSTVMVPQHNDIIADIVARDLARLCGRPWRPLESD